MRPWTSRPAGSLALALAAVSIFASACGSDDEPDGSEGPAESVSETVIDSVPTDALGPAATEAAPEAPPQGATATSDLAESDQEAVRAVVESYVAGLNGHDAARVCGLFEPGGLPIRELPVRRGDCVASLAPSIGRRPPRGGPAWKRTTVEEVTAVSVGGERARVTATVVHDFSDRRQPSLEEDVIYLDRLRDRWLLAKPSATLYRAVGYAEPPLRAFTPPRG
jgi:hypothetical protein